MNPTQRRMLNKVPEVTLYFWIIKILCTTVGETFADNLNEKLGLGLTNTTYVMGALLIAVLVAQFRSRRYIPGIYWLAVVLLSVVGTLITDNIVEHGVALQTTTIIFTGALIAVFVGWYAVERTLSVHTIVTTRREAFYWLAILFTFALGTSAGDFLSEKLAFGYLGALGMFAGAIAVITVLHLVLKMNAILSFWLAYILTRPLGASIGDLLAQPTGEGGLGLGTYVTSAIFLSAILALVVYLTLSRKDVIRSGAGALAAAASPAVLVVLNKVEPTPSLLDAVRRRAATATASFHVLVPNPHNLGFDHGDPHPQAGEDLLARAIPGLQDAAGAGEVSGRVADSPNAYDDIVAELDGGAYSEIIIETPPTHLSHWLHVDLPQRVSQLGLPTEAVAAT
jgi:uncharacterized membrane-anchored protein